MNLDPKEARALVEQMSRGAPACDGCGDRPGYAVECLLDEAADTLTAALAENERLREALEKIEQQSAYGQIDICNRLAIEALGDDQ